MRQSIGEAISSFTSTYRGIRGVLLGAALILVVVSSCSRAGDETATPTIVETPTNTPQIPVATETEQAGLPDGWDVFTNEVYGYQFFYPASASITTIGPQGFNVWEMPEGISDEEYLAQIQEFFGDKLCVRVDYELGYILISAPPNQDFGYTICGITGLGVGEVTEKTEEVMVGETSYLFNGFEFISEEEPAGTHLEMLQYELDDGTRIEFGSSGNTGVSFEDYMASTRDTLLEILASLDFSLPGTFDWDSYEPPVPSVTPSAEEDILIFVADVTIPDGSIFEPEEVFTKTWRVQNGGENTWTTGYALLFHEGDRMGGLYEVHLEEEVHPNQTVDISVELIAPKEPGTYTGYWIMRNPDGVLLGTGPENDQPFFVMIEVIGSATGTDTPPDIGDGSTVTGATLSANPSTYSGECPVSVSFPGTINSEGAGSYIFQLEAGTSSAGFTFSLPPAQKGTFTTGGSHQLNVSYTLDIADSVEAWARLYISAPNTYRSAKIQFTVSCD
jgi:hypothetical protein